MLQLSSVPGRPAGRPDEFIAQCKFTLVLSFLQLFPRSVDVGQHLAFTWRVRLLVVCTHLALNGEQQNLQVTLLHKPASDADNNTPTLSTIHQQLTVHNHLK